MSSVRGRVGYAPLWQSEKQRCIKTVGGPLHPPLLKDKTWNDHKMVQAKKMRDFVPLIWENFPVGTQKCHLPKIGASNPKWPTSPSLTDMRLYVCSVRIDMPNQFRVHKTNWCFI